VTLPRWLTSVLFAASVAATAVAQAATPTATEVADRVKQLAPDNPAARRVDALKWLNRHAKAAADARPAVARCLTGEPNAGVRAAAVNTLALMAHQLGEPCPVAVVEAVLDADEQTRINGSDTAGLFRTFAPGCVDVLLRAVKSKDADVRTGAVMHLALAGGKEKAVRDAIRGAARDDPRLSVRHNAHCSLFQATGDLPEFLAYIVRLQEDPDGVLGPVDAATEAGKRDQVTRNLASIGGATLVAEWSDARAADLAPALMNLLDSKSPAVRRGAARLIGASAVKVDIAGIKKMDGLEPLFDPKPAGPASPPQPSKAAAHFERLKAADRLRVLEEKDPDLTVRAAATTALARLASVRPKDAALP